MASCVFRYCKNTRKNISKSSGVTFHRFLNPGDPRREEWIKILQKDRSEDTWLPTNNSYICSAHFQDGDIYTTKCGRCYLKKSAVLCDDSSKYANENLRASPTSLDNVELSETESIFDTPRQIRLKKDLRKVSAAKKVMSKKYIQLRRQNRHLKKRTEKLTAMVKQLKEKLRQNTISPFCNKRTGTDEANLV